MDEEHNIDYLISSAQIYDHIIRKSKYLFGLFCSIYQGLSGYLTLFSNQPLALHLAQLGLCSHVGGKKLFGKQLFTFTSRVLIFCL